MWLCVWKNFIFAGLEILCLRIKTLNVKVERWLQLKKLRQTLSKTLDTIINGYRNYFTFCFHAKVSSSSRWPRCTSTSSTWSFPASGSSASPSKSVRFRNSTSRFPSLFNIKNVAQSKPNHLWSVKSPISWSSWRFFMQLKTGSVSFCFGKNLRVENQNEQIFIRDQSCHLAVMAPRQLKTCYSSRNGYGGAAQFLISKVPA